MRADAPNDRQVPGLDPGHVQLEPDLLALFHMLPIPVLLLDTQLRYAAANEANNVLLGMNGMTTEDVLGKPFGHVLGSSPFVVRLRAQLEQVLATGRPFRRTESVKIDNRTMVLAFTAAPRRGDDGEIHGVWVAVQDQTEQHRLLDRFVRFIQVISSMDVSMTQRMRWMLEVVCTELGFTRGIITRQSHGTCTVISEWSAHKEALQGSAHTTAVCCCTTTPVDTLRVFSGDAGGPCQHLERCNVHPAAVAGVRLSVAEGSYATLCLSADELLPSKIGAQDRDFIRLVGQWAVVEMQRQDAEERLQATLAEANEANDELQRFAYVVSHDLKAPLRAVRNLADWFSDETSCLLNEEAQAHLSAMRDRVDRMQHLIDAVLEYSRAGQANASVELTDLRAVIQDALLMVDLPDGAEVTLPESLPVLLLDRIRWQQVFQNLLTNAVKHCKISDLRIRITCEPINGDWRIGVADNGPGIAPEHHQRIFDMFSTLNGDDNRINSGIGLALVRRIVERHGGRIWVESEPGHGAAFYFTLRGEPYGRAEGGSP